MQTILSQVAPGFQRPAPGQCRPRHRPPRPLGPARRSSSRTWSTRLQRSVSGFPGARAFPVNPPSLGQRGFANQQIQFVLGGPDYETLRDWRDIVMQKAQATGQFINLDSDYKEIAAGPARADRPRPRRRPRRLGRGYRQDARIDVRRAGDLDLRQPRPGISGDRARPLAGPRHPGRPRQHLHARARTAISCRSPPSFP